MLSDRGTLDFLAQHARVVVVDRESVAAIEVIDPDPSTNSRRQANAESRRDIAVPAG
jgi:hypothetical protein